MSVLVSAGNRFVLLGANTSKLDTVSSLFLLRIDHYYAKVDTDVEVEVDLRLPSMLHGKKGFERVVWAFKNVLNHAVTWLFHDFNACPEATNSRKASSLLGKLLRERTHQQELTLSS